MPIEKGNKVKVHYTGKLEDGTVFDSSEGKEPLEFEVGSGKVIKGFEEALVGMEKGEEKEITLPPEQAYGDVNPQLVQKIPRDKIPEGNDPQPGMFLALKTPDGKQIPAKITEVTDQEVTIDINPPLAGKTLNFKLKIEDYS